MNRELIATTLFDRFVNSQDFLNLGFQTFSRDQLDPAKIQQWNALCLLGGNEIWPGPTGREARQSNRPAIVTLEFLLWIYAKAVPGTLRETLMNDIQDAIDKTMAPTTDYRQPLGLRGVKYCAREQAVLRAPVPNSNLIYAHSLIVVEAIERVDTQVIP